MKRIDPQTGDTPVPSRSALAHFFIYENLNYVADSKISKEQISIGRSFDADLVLNHRAVADIHASIHFEGPQAFLTNHYPNNGLNLNGRSVHRAKLQHEDVIDIGPFALKIKMEHDRDRHDADHGLGRQMYGVVLVNRYKKKSDMLKAVSRLARRFKGDPVKLTPMVAMPEYLIKKDLSKTDAERWHIALQKSGVFCEIRVMGAEKPVRIRELYRSHPAVETRPAGPAKPSTDGRIFCTRSADEPRQAATASSTDPATEHHFTAECTDQFLQVSTALSVGSTAAVDTTSEQSFDAEPADQSRQAADALPAAGPAAAGPVSDRSDADPAVWCDDDDDDEEDQWQAPFSLEKIMADGKLPGVSAKQSPTHVQVVKTIGDRVADVRHLGKGEKYTITTEAGDFCLVRNKSHASRFVCLARGFRGHIINAKGEVTADLNNFRRPEYLVKKDPRLYRIPVSESGEIVIRHNQCQYRVFASRPTPSPAIQVAENRSEFTWKHWAVSAGTHLVLLLCLSIYLYFQAAAPEPAKPHFVQIDPTMLQQLRPKPEKPPEPPKVEPAPKPKPQPVAKKVEPPKKRARKQPPKPVAKPTEPKRKIKKTARAKMRNRHPKAGGGSGKGNVKNRDINQTGLLSVLGKTTLNAPSAAIASVTNLDAVPVPDAGDKNFSVGGVKGSLGNGKISVAGGQMLQTKGSDQVFRSAGAKGPGAVAALQRGTTGKKKVQGLVTAKMSRSVKVQGGMSREMVKRVIDQHLEQITYCYETALMTNPSIMGRIVFEWKIRLDGSVGQVRVVASSINSHDIHGCIQAAIKSWQFPRPVDTEVMVSYPFVFDLVAF
jgi:outer membrane biosynthesis protein TonB